MAVEPLLVLPEVRAVVAVNLAPVERFPVVRERPVKVITVVLVSMRQMVDGVEEEALAQ